MRTCLVFLVALAPLLGLAPTAHAHIGDQIYPFYELLDEDLDRIDLTDASVEDWIEVVGEPSLTAADFYYPYSSYDPASCDNRFWLAWHRRSGTLWVAMERFDDIYHNNFAGEVDEWGALNDEPLGFLLQLHGRRRSLRRPVNLFGEELKLQNNRQAQHWMAIAETADGQQVAYDGASEWVTREPYAAAGGGVLGSTPCHHGHRDEIDPLRRPHLRRRGRFHGLGAESGQDHRLHHQHARQRLHRIP